jgi:hypothetical protein
MNGPVPLTRALPPSTPTLSTSMIAASPAAGSTRRFPKLTSR